MVEGESGLLSINPTIRYEPSKRRLTWPNGSMATTFSADEPDRLRGPQHHRIWCDELAAWRYGQQTWDMAMFGLRLGSDPRAIVTTTPKPVKLVRDLMDPKREDVVITTSTTYANADNLAPSFLSSIVRRYEGTRMGRQELQGELLEDVEGALWSYAIIDAARVSTHPDLARAVVAIDPSGSSDGDAQGIVICGTGSDGHGYVLADRTCHLSPDGWARRAVQAYQEFNADRIVAEKNYGGDMVEHTIRTAARDMGLSVPVTVITATRGKRQRAEPVAALYEQQRVHHVGSLPELEDEMTQWTPESGESPNRMDALVWALSHLMVRGGGLKLL